MRANWGGKQRDENGVKEVEKWVEKKDKKGQRNCKRGHQMGGKY